MITRAGAPGVSIRKIFVVKAKELDAFLIWEVAIRNFVTADS